MRAQFIPEPSLKLIVEPGLYMLLRFQKAAVRENYETGNQAFSRRLRFLTIRDIVWGCWELKRKSQFRFNDEEKTDETGYVQDTDAFSGAADVSRVATSASLPTVVPDTNSRGEVRPHDC